MCHEEGRDDMKKFLLVFFCTFLVISFQNVCYMKTDYLSENYRILERAELDESDPDYWIKIYDPGKRTLKMSENYEPISKYESGKVTNYTTRTTANTKYNVYSANGTLKYSNLKSVFDAINKANNVNDYVKESDTGIIIFTKNNSTGTYYKFQFTKYYGTTTSTSEIENWINNFAFTHVFDGTGELIKNSYYSIRGTPDLYTLEPHGGGYFAKFSYGYENFRAVKTNINLTSAQMKFSTTSDNNAYIFQAAVTPTQTIEVGIMTGKGFDGKWVVYKNDPQDGFVVVYPNRIAALSSKSSNGVYTFSSDVELKLKLTNGGAIGIINSDILSSYEVNATGTSFSTTSSPIAFFHMVSYVPVDCDDMRNGAYLKNVALNNSKLYKNTTFSGTAYNFYADSSTTVNFSYIYNDDVISYTKNSSTKESIDIDYSVEYME